MYLHIGKEYVVNTKNIIGIFNIEDIKIKDNLIDISDGNKKTIILVDNKKIKGYITNISSSTLKKRDV